MKKEYEEYFNSPESLVNVDGTWDRFRAGIDLEIARYAYSAQYLHGDVLEVGAGDGYFASLVCIADAVNTVTCLEVQDKAIAKLKINLAHIGNAHIVKETIEEFQSPMKHDSIHCGHTLEHVLDLEASLIAMHRLQAETVVISVPRKGRTSRQHLRVFNDVDQFRKMIAEYWDEAEYKVLPRPGKSDSLVIIAKRKEND